MNDFIDHNIQFLMEWGQIIIGLIILIAVFLIYRIERKHKFYLPKRVLGFIGNLVLMSIIIFGSIAIITIEGMKPQVLQIVNGLESLKGKKAENLTFNLITDDSEKNIEDYRGDVVLLNYWATWCPGCITEMPELNKLQETYKELGITIITISDEDKGKISKFIEKHPTNLISGYLKTFDWVDLGSARPLTILIDRKGVIVDYFIGSYDYHFFETQILNQIK